METIHSVTATQVNKQIQFDILADHSTEQDNSLLL